jgi:hypothetical protein
VQSSTTVYPTGTQVRLTTTLLHVVVYVAPPSPIGVGGVGAVLDAAAREAAERTPAS